MTVVGLEIEGERKALLGKDKKPPLLQRLYRQFLFRELTHQSQLWKHKGEAAVAIDPTCTLGHSEQDEESKCWGKRRT